MGDDDVRRRLATPELDRHLAIEQQPTATRGGTGEPERDPAKDLRPARQPSDRVGVRRMEDRRQLIVVRAADAA
jgi:hypothetical protein